MNPVDEWLAIKSKQDKVTRLEAALAAMTAERDELLQAISELRQSHTRLGELYAAGVAKLEAVGLIAFDIETGRLKQDLAIHRRLIKALATTGPSLIQRVEKVVEKLSKQVASRAVREECKSCIRYTVHDLEAALKGTP